MGVRGPSPQPHQLALRKVASRNLTEVGFWQCTVLFALEVFQALVFG